MTTADASGRVAQPPQRGKVATRLAEVFKLQRDQFNLPRGLVILAVVLVPAIVLWVVGKDQYCSA